MSYENEENENSDKVEEEIGTEKQGKRKWIRVVAIITAISLTIMIMFPLFRNMNLPSLDFLKESAKLTEKSKIKSLQKSIVTITVGNKKGTGFNIDENGLIATNAHVVEDEESVSVSFYEGEDFEGEVWETYKDADLALIKIEGKNLPKLKLAQDTNDKKGDEVLIIGNPLAYEGIANKGTIYGRSEVEGLNKPILLIDVPVNEGNSGSPVLNKEGQVIGIIFGIVDSEKLSDKKLGAAIPIEYLQNLDSINKELK